MKPYQDITDPTVAKALAHPLRTRVLAALEDRTASPSELAGELEVRLGVLSYHVRRLATLGFLKLVKRVPRRGAVEHYYTARSGLGSPTRRGARLRRSSSRQPWVRRSARSAPTSTRLRQPAALMPRSLA